MAQDPNSTYYGNYYGQNYYNNQYYNYYGYNAYNQYYDPYSNYNNYYETQQDEDMEALEEPEVEVDVFRYNKDYMEQSEEIFDVLELSRWTPLDSVNSKLPTVKLV